MAVVEVPQSMAYAIVAGVPPQIGLDTSIVQGPRSVPGDGFVCLTTLVCTLLAPLQYAIFIGIFLNVALYLRKASRPHMTGMRSTSGGAYEEQPLRDCFGRERVLARAEEIVGARMVAPDASGATAGPDR